MSKIPSFQQVWLFCKYFLFFRIGNIFFEERHHYSCPRHSSSNLPTPILLQYTHSSKQLREHFKESFIYKSALNYAKTFSEENFFIQLARYSTSVVFQIFRDLSVGTRGPQKGKPYITPNAQALFFSYSSKLQLSVVLHGSAPTPPS